MGPITHLGRLLQRYIDHPGAARMPQNHPSLDDRVRFMDLGKLGQKTWLGVGSDRTLSGLLT